MINSGIIIHVICPVQGIYRKYRHFRWKLEQNKKSAINCNLLVDVLSHLRLEYPFI
jgi:hypothetical protein